MNAREKLDQALASMDDPARKERFLRALSGFLTRACESQGEDLGPIAKMQRLHESVEAWFSLPQGTLPPLDEEARAEIRRLLDVTTIHEATFEEEDIGGHDTQTRCEFSIGGWRSWLGWHYNYPRHRADVLSGPGLTGWDVSYGYTELPSLPKRVFKTIPTTLHADALAYYIYLVGFETHREPDGAPYWEVKAMVNLNTADAAALASLPGLGRAKAEQIIQHREEVGPFKDVSDLTDLRGIGASIVKKLSGLACV